MISYILASGPTHWLTVDVWIPHRQGYDRRSLGESVPLTLRDQGAVVNGPVGQVWVAGARSAPLRMIVLF